MAKLFIAVCVLSLALADAHFWPPRPRCTTVPETLYRPECKVTNVEHCVQVPKTIQKTISEQVCKTVSEKKCEQVFRDVPDKQCATTQDQVCVEEQTTTFETTFKENCVSVPSEQCVPVGVADSLGPVGVAPACTTVYTPVCEQVAIQTPRTVSVPRCTSVPRTTCVDITRQVAETKCVDVPRQACQQVPRQIDVQVSEQKCETVPKKSCVQYPVTVPRRVCP
jgi:hypothetical protein